MKLCFGPRETLIDERIAPEAFFLYAFPPVQYVYKSIFDMTMSSFVR